MPSISEQVAIAEALHRLEELLGAPARIDEHPILESGARPDAVARIGDDLYVIEVKSSSSAATIAGATEQLLRYVSQLRGRRRATPLLVVPYMPPSGRSIAGDRGVSWLDLSGNAHIRTARTLIRIEGEPNRFKQRGRPSTPFAPKSSRVARWFLVHPDHAVNQQELADSTGLDQGHVSRIVRRLLDNALLRRTSDGRLVVPDPDLLLDAWRAEYDFRKHHVVKGHLPAQSGPDGLARLTNALAGADVGCAATGLAGAWLLTRFAAFRLVSVYLRRPVPSSVLAELGFQEDARGANTWLVIPNDESVFEDATLVDGVPCVHPLQVYLDLAAQPERATDAADEIRRQFLTWRVTHADHAATSVGRETSSRRSSRRHARSSEPGAPPPSQPSRESASSEIAARQPELEAVCRRFGVRRLELFGSAATGGFREGESDLDFLVNFATPVDRGYADRYFGLLEALQELFGRPVDLVVESAITNPYFRESVERTRKLLYAA